MNPAVFVYHNRQLFTGERADRDATWEQEKRLREGEDPKINPAYLQLVAEVKEPLRKMPNGTTPSTHLEMVEAAYFLTNTIDSPWWEGQRVNRLYAFSQKKCRSTSILDVVCIMEEVEGKPLHSYYAIAPMGAVKIELPQVWSIGINIPFADPTPVLQEPYWGSVYVNDIGIDATSAATPEALMKDLRERLQYQMTRYFGN